MKRFLFAVLGMGLIVGSALAQQEKAAPKTAAPAGKDDFKSLKERASYALGLVQARGMKAQAADFDLEAMIQGLRDGLSDNPPKLTDEQIGQALQEMSEQANKALAERNKNLGEKNQKEGEAFLATNQKKPKVKVLPSGLQYEVIKEGTGKSPKPTDLATIHYEGRLLDNTVFDSSYERGEPAELPVGRLIPGMTEALQNMKEGSKWRVFIPGDLAYGEKPGGPGGPNATLIFDVELLKIASAPATTPSPGGLPGIPH